MFSFCVPQATGPTEDKSGQPNAINPPTTPTNTMTEAIGMLSSINASMIANPITKT